MKAYEVKRGSKVILLEDAQAPVEESPLSKGDIITIYRLDGMYCNGSKDGERVYVSAFTEVELITN